MAIDERRRIAHLLRRAGFGASSAELDDYAELGFEASVDRLLHPETVPDDGALDLDLTASGIDPNRPGAATLRWLYRMVHTPRPLEEKIAFFWHGHFATSIEKVKSAPAMWRQYELFRTSGLGRFEDLTLAVSRDPAMLIWLDNWRSRKEAPNENFGRELLELFTLGVGNYTEADVQAATRAFTGWTLERPDGNQGEQSGADPTLTEDERRRAQKERRQTQRDNAACVFKPNWHDAAEKTFLGETGAWDGGDIVRLATNHPACARFITRKLFGFFVWDDPDDGTLMPFIEIFAASGGDIRETFGAMLRSDAFASERAYRAKVASPVEFVVGTLRTLGGDIGTGAIVQTLRAMGQTPFAPPHVGGWPSGLAWVGQSTALARANVVNAMLGGGPTGRRRERDGASAPDLTSFLGDPLPATPESAVDLVADLILQGDLTTDQRDALLAYLAAGVGDPATAFEPGSETYEAKLRGLIRLATTVPAYHLN